MEEVRDVKKWLESNGINRRWAMSTLLQAKRQYPALGRALRSEQSNNRAELELVQLIDHILKGRFPVPGQKS